GRSQAERTPSISRAPRIAQVTSSGRGGAAARAWRAQSRWPRAFAGAPRRLDDVTCGLVEEQMIEGLQADSNLRRVNHGFSLLAPGGRAQAPGPGETRTIVITRGSW